MDPRGVCTGFLTLSNEAEFLYKTTDFYNKESEKSIHWKNNEFNIDWPKVEARVLTSKKDS